ncbi:MAG: UDP-N-acetylglucosamine 2-epimerase (non-hydrolyzing) [Chitinophagales bacterium]
MKVVTIAGARPQFIKAAAVSRVLRQEKGVHEILLHTGQHFDANMSKIFFDELGISNPDYNLGISCLQHGAMTGRMLERIENILIKEKPDWVLVFGDTNSTIAGALGAAKLHLKVAHVESGMRSFNRNSPEEINRVICDRISDLLLCSTTTAVKNLYNEGFARFACDIIQTGDVMYDAALYYSEKASRASRIMRQIPFKEFVLCTLHRQENTGDISILKRLILSLKKIHQKIPIVLPVHPGTRSRIQSLDLKLPFHIIDPVGYFDMLTLVKNCSLILTDSGGLQKEAFFFSKFCITLRDETEWVELVKLGVNKVTGSNQEKILSAFEFFMNKEFKSKARPYGNGDASEKIVAAMLRYS